MRQVTNLFTMDSSHVYTVTDGIVTREEWRHPVWVYSMTGTNVGYLNPDEQGALLIDTEEDVIIRIDHGMFTELRSAGIVRPANAQGVIKITYDADYYTFERLGGNGCYKDNDRPKPQSSSSAESKELGKTKSLWMSNNHDAEVADEEDVLPDELQNLALDKIGRKVIPLEIEVYAKIINAIDKDNRYRGIGVTTVEFDTESLLSLREKVVFNTRCEEFVAYELIGTKTMVSINDVIYSYMKRMIDMYEVVKKHEKEKTPTQNKSNQSRVREIPAEIQDAAKQFIGRVVTEREIKLYRLILNSIDNTNGTFVDLNSDDDSVFDKLFYEGFVTREMQNGTIPKVSVPDKNKLNFMRRIVKMYDDSLKSGTGLSDDLQRYAMSKINRQVTDVEVEVYRKIINANKGSGERAGIGNTKVEFDTLSLNDKELDVFNTLCSEFIITSNVIGLKMYVITNSNTIDYMIKIIHMYYNGANANKVLNAASMMSGE